MKHLSLSFLGGFEVRLDTEPVSAFGSDKVRALLAYLAIESARPHRRAELSAMFWPDLSEERAAHNLRQTLLRLRGALGEKKDSQSPLFLSVTPQNVQFNINSDCQLDVAGFRELLNSCVHHHHNDAANCEVCVQWLRQAADLYHGNLLAGLFVPDSVAFEEWRLVQQEGLHAQALETLLRLVALYERRGDFKQVQEYARRLIALEPWSEEAQMKLMRALVQGGQTSAALRQYESYQRALEEELGISPSADVTSYYEQVRAGEAAEQPQTGGNTDVVWLSSEGERRQITTLLCSHAGTEDSDEQINTCEGHCAAIFNRFGGRRAQRHGDVCLIYFGYPQAFEDAARRAVHSGLALAGKLKEENSPIRIGIHTGMMTVGEKRGRRWQDRDVLGKTPEIARECLRLAGSGEVIVTEQIQRLTQDSFDFESIGSSPTGTPVYRARSERAVQSRLEWLAQTQRLTAFVGHATELDGLRSAHVKLLQGEGQIILLRGEPGIGKSRLVWELQKSIPIVGMANGVINTEARKDLAPVLWLAGRCLPHYQNTSLYPIVGLLEGLLGFQAEDSLDVRKEKLIAMLASYQLDRPSALWLLSLLLGLPTDGPTPETITKEQREQMRELLITLLQKRAAEQPLVLVIEDLHWSDPSTAEWLSQSVDSLTAVPCLTLLTARPNFNPAWVSKLDTKPKLLVLALDPLLPEHAEEMMTDLAGGNMLNEELRSQIVTQTDGIPLFIEELTKTLLEQPVAKVGRHRKLEIPPSLVDSLIARLDHLGTAKETAQWASVLGREFSYTILQACIPYDEQRLQSDLARLIEAELISLLKPSARDNSPTRPRGSKAGSPARYTFKHALVQEVAHNSMLKRTRQVYHRRIAEMLETRFSQIAATRPELLAQHFFEAGMPSQAGDFWIKAGKRATAQGATLEAQVFFDRALEVVEPDDHEQRWQALEGREHVFDLRAEHESQKQDIDALLELAEAFHDDTRRAQAFLYQMKYALRLNDYLLAKRAAETVIAVSRAGDLELQVQALGGRVHALTSLGEWEAAEQAAQEALIKLPNITNAVIQAYTLGEIAIHSQRVGDLSRTLLLLAEAAQAARRAGDQRWESRIDVIIGLTYIQLGSYVKARTTLEEGLELARSIGERGLPTMHMDNLSYVYWCLGEQDRALELAERALHEYRASSFSLYGQAGTLNDLGLYLESAGRWSAAAAHLAEARALYAQLGTKSNCVEPQVTEARCMLALGRHDEAQSLASEAWKYLLEYGSTGIFFPALVYLGIIDVASAIETQGVTAREVLEAGYRDLIQRAEKISDPEWRRSFLENVAENREIVGRWKKMNEANALA